MFWIAEQLLTSKKKSVIGVNHLIICILMWQIGIIRKLWVPKHGCIKRENNSECSKSNLRIFVINFWDRSLCWQILRSYYIRRTYMIICRNTGHLKFADCLNQSVGLKRLCIETISLHEVLVEKFYCGIYRCHFRD